MNRDEAEEKIIDVLSAKEDELSDESTIYYESSWGLQMYTALKQENFRERLVLSEVASEILDSIEEFISG